MPGSALTADKPLNARQELFCQGVVRGMTLKAAYRAAGYRHLKGEWVLARKPNVRARIAALLDGMAAQSFVNTAQLTQRLLGVADTAETGTSAAMLREARQALMDVAKINGLANPKPAAPKFEPITVIRRVVVEPDGREWEY